MSLIVPIRLAFSDSESFWWSLFYIITDTIFLIDIILTFLTTINDTEKIYEITDKKKIAKQYLKGWFLIDFLSILPIDIMLMVNNEANMLVRFARIGKLYKLIRMIRLAKVFKLLKSRNGVINQFA